MNAISLHFIRAIIVASLIFLQPFALSAQTLRIKYSGSNQKIIEAVSEANKILNNPAFYSSVDSIKKFDNTSFTGQQIINEMNAVKTVEVGEYFKRLTKATAKTQSQIRINAAKLNRSLASRVNTLIHESIHATDWLTNKNWDYTHRTQYEEDPPVSAPYVIGAIAERMVD